MSTAAKRKPTKPAETAQQSAPEEKPVFALNAMRLSDFITSVLGYPEGNYDARFDNDTKRWVWFRLPKGFEDLECEEAVRVLDRLTKNGNSLPEELVVCWDLDDTPWITDEPHAKQIRALADQHEELASRAIDVLYSPQAKDWH